jgi:23S rRNA (adenine2030-N6)-methyltransferase
MNAFERRVIATGIRRILQLEISVHLENWAMSLRGCGLLVVNPPFGFEGTARKLLAWLAPVLSRGAAPAAQVRWLVAE